MKEGILLNNIVRKFNQNSRTIFFDVFIVICIIICIQVVNHVIKKQNENKNNETNNIQNISSNEKKTSTLTEKTVNEKTNDENIKLIDEFINLCNEKNPKKAYELLSEDCKEQKFSTEEEFINNYYSKFFETKKEYDYQMWINKINQYTYQVKLYNNDLMATGGQESSYIEEYYTVIKENDVDKLNINNFVCTKVKNNEESNSNITVKVLKRDIFMEYETYMLEIINNSGKNILIDSKEKTDTIYVQDEKENKYPSYSHEISQDKLIVRAGETRKVKVKYTKQYTSTLESKNLVFSDIILDYDQYKQVSNKKEYTNRCEISVKL